MNINPNGESSVSVDLEGPDRISNLITRLFRSFPVMDR